ncbi:MAG: O-methyltransferase [Hyphomicrobiales bacterium]
MPASLDLAGDLTSRRGERFAAIRDDIAAHIASHRCASAPLSPIDVREVEVLVASTRATYVLEVGAGLGEATVHMAAAFGRTGRLDAIEPDPAHGAFLESLVRRLALDSVIRVNIATPANVISALSGPYDLLVVHRDLDTLVPVYEDVIRLLRTGGSLAIRVPEAERPAASRDGGLLARMAEDPRLLPWFAPALDRVIAARVR